MLDWVENFIQNLPSSQIKRNRLLDERLAMLKRSPHRINLNSLPDEMIANIFKFLPSRTITEVRRLDSRMNRIACKTKGTHFTRVPVQELKFEKFWDDFYVTIVCEEDRRQFVKKYPDRFPLLILLYFWLQRVKVVGALRFKFPINRLPFKFSQLEIGVIAYNKSYFGEMRELDLNHVVFSDDLLKFFVSLAPKMNSLVLQNMHYLNSQDHKVVGAFGMEFPRYRPPFKFSRHHLRIIAKHHSYFRIIKELDPNHVVFSGELLKFFDEMSAKTNAPPLQISKYHSMDPKLLLDRQWKKILIHHTSEPLGRNSLWTDDILLQIVPNTENFKTSATSITKRTLIRLIKIAHKTTKFWAKWDFGLVGFLNGPEVVHDINTIPGVRTRHSLQHAHISVYFFDRMSDTNYVEFDMVPT